MKFAASVHPAQHIQRLPFEGMALTNDGYLLRISSEVVVVGSLSSGSSAVWTTDGSCAFSTVESEIHVLPASSADG